MNEQKPKIVIEVDTDMADIMPIFLDGLTKDVALAEEALKKSDFQFLVNFAHKLRGNAPSYGFIDLGLMGTALEKLAKGNELNSCRDLFKKIEDYVSRLEVKYV